MDIIPAIFVTLTFLCRMLEMGIRNVGHRERTAGIWSLPLMLLSGMATVIVSIDDYLSHDRSIDYPLFFLGLFFGVFSFLLRHRAAVALGANWSMHASIREAHTLVTSGPYGYIRHPIYSAACLELIGAIVSLRSMPGLLVFLFFALPVIIARMLLEERLLSDRFGVAYANYAHRTPRLIGLVNRNRR